MYTWNVFIICEIHCIQTSLQSRKNGIGLTSKENKAECVVSSMERVGAQENKLLNEEKYQVRNTPSKKWSCYPRYEYILSFIPVDAIKAFCCNTESDDTSNDLQVMLRRNLLHM